MKITTCPNSEIANLTCALYSVEQNCYHVEELYQYINENILNALHQFDAAGYRLIGVFDNYAEAAEFIEYFKKSIKVILNKNGMVSHKA